jgi:hypothetical protein
MKKLLPIAAGAITYFSLLFALNATVDDKTLKKITPLILVLPLPILKIFLVKKLDSASEQIDKIKSQKLLNFYIGYVLSWFISLLIPIF